MPWAAIIGAGATMFAANQADDGSPVSPELERIAAKQELRADDAYRTYKGVYAPRERQFLDRAFDDARTPAGESARAGAETRAAIDNSELIAGRNARRMGINPASPAFASLQRRNQAADAGLEAAARTGGRRYAMETNDRNQLAALSLGRNLPAFASGESNAAAGLYGEIGALERSRSEAAGELYGQAGAQISDLATRRRRSPAPTQTTAGADFSWDDIAAGG